MENIYFHCNNCSIDNSNIKNGQIINLNELISESITNTIETCVSLEKLFAGYLTFIWNNSKCQYCTFTLKEQLKRIKNKGYNIKDARTDFNLICDKIDKQKECRVIEKYLTCYKILNFLSISSKYVHFTNRYFVETQIKKDKLHCISVGTIINVHDSVSDEDLFKFQQLMSINGLQLVSKYPLANKYVVEAQTYTKKAVK